jgi:excisionase family DNA binding protein
LGGEEISMDKLLMNPKEAAEMLSISRSKLYELLAAGTLSSVRIDGCRRIAVDVLRNYVDQLRAAEMADPGGVAA